MIKPRADLKPNTADYENLPLVTANGFREYDARWLFGKEINLLGIQALGLGLGTYLHDIGVKPKVVTGHDFRSYSLSIKQALILGLMRAGCEVHDIGLALSPVAYFAQFALDCPAVAMVTASHNENGWTGVKMGAQRPLTFGPDEIDAHEGDRAGRRWARNAPGGAYVAVPDMRETYLAGGDQGPQAVAADQGGRGLRQRHGRRLRARSAAPHRRRGDRHGHRAGLHLPQIQSQSRRPAHAARHGRCGEGAGRRSLPGLRRRRRPLRRGGRYRAREIFADKIGVLLARDLSAQHKNAQFVVDVKSTGLYLTDPVLKERGVKTDYWKTGHSYIKRRTAELKRAGRLREVRPFLLQSADRPRL